MGTITAIIASAIAGHLGGMAIGGTLASRGLLGFVAEAGKAAHAARPNRNQSLFNVKVCNTPVLRNSENHSDRGLRTLLVIS